MQGVSKKQKDNRGDENKDPRGNFSLWHHSYSKHKHCLTPSKISIKPPLKAYLSQFLLPRTSCIAFKQKSEVILKDKKFGKTEQALESDSEIAEMLK